MTEFSFCKTSRILKRENFLEIGKKGRRLRTTHFTILYFFNSLGIKRCGVTASKKVGNAVQRNRVKRLVREFFRLNRGIVPDSVDLIFIAGKNSYRLAYKEAAKELADSILKIPVKKNKDVIYP